MLNEREDGLRCGPDAADECGTEAAGTFGRGAPTAFSGSTGEGAGAGGVRRVAMLTMHSSPLAEPGSRQAGGMNVYVRELARELARRAIRVDIYTGAPGEDERRIVEAGEGVRVINLPVHRTPGAGGVCSPDRVPDFVEGVARHAANEKISYDVIHSHYWLSGLAALELKRRWRAPVVQMFHTLGAIKNSIAPDLVWRETGARLAAEARLTREADKVIAATPLDLAQIEAHSGGALKNASVVPCGVDANKFRPLDQAAARKCLNLPARPTRLILFVGRIEPLKGLDTLLRAVCLLRGEGVGGARAGRTPTGGADVRLVVVGGDRDPACGGDRWGAEERRLRRLADELGVGARVEFAGARPHDQLPLYYNAADVLVAPSRYESFCLVALEAQACATPVVASGVGGLKFTVRDGATGFLAEPDDAPGFAARVGELLADEELRRTFSLNARLNARHFAWPRVADRIVDLYGELRGEVRLARAAGVI